VEIKCQLDATEVFIADLIAHINDEAGQNHIKLSLLFEIRGWR